MSRIAGSRADYLLPVGHPLLRAETIALIVGLAALVLSVIGLVADCEQFFQSWLIAYLFWLGPTLGSMGILMLQHITGGRWGVALRRTLEQHGSLLSCFARHDEPPGQTLIPALGGFVGELAGAADPSPQFLLARPETPIRRSSVMTPKGVQGRSIGMRWARRPTV